MNNNETKVRINSIIERATPDELAALLRIITPNIRKHLLREKPIGAETDLVELPRAIADEVMAAVKTMYAKFNLKWSDGKSDTEKQIEATIERMSDGSHD